MTEEQKTRIRKLVDALRSGEFRKTRGALRRGNCYCALGVACEIYRRETGIGAWSPPSWDGRRFFAPGGSYSSPHHSVVAWFGFPEGAAMGVVAEMNDRLGTRLRDVAKLIEWRYLTEAK